MKSLESRKIFFLNYENLCHCENTPFMHILIREKISNGPVGHGLRDATRRQVVKNSTGSVGDWSEIGRRSYFCSVGMKF